MHACISSTETSEAVGVNESVRGGIGERDLIEWPGVTPGVNKRFLRVVVVDSCVVLPLSSSISLSSSSCWDRSCSSSSSSSTSS